MTKVTGQSGAEYHKSASANATEAPTSGSTQSAAQSTKAALVRLTEVEIDFVTMLDMHWGTTGELLSSEQALERFGLPVGVYNQCMTKQYVLDALAERGVTARIEVAELENWRHATLTPEQLLVANTMLDLIDTRNDRKKLNDLGVTTARYNNWLRQPEFRAYLQGRAESLIGASQHEALLALVDRMRSGDTKAIELYWEYTGKFIKSGGNSGGSSTGAISAETVTGLVQSIIEIIVEEVDDPILGARISDRLGKLIQARSAATQLVNGMTPERVIVPEIMPDREITPEIEALMNAGVGSDT